ncbi:hypothetical protein QCA50_014848 [Cerrena zonata]|uniref:Type I restriction enzyme R protein N-terminal domain-containing protein n=1 Tax=Cerrena zonata TaxID=2478898 RepID=A0AAW0FWY4_9APHY
MILDATFKALWRSSEHARNTSIVSVIPEFKPPSDGIQVMNPKTGQEYWLMGSIDYFLTCHKKSRENRRSVLELDSYTGELILQETLQFTKNQMFLIEAKCKEDRPFNSYLPEAIGQALALCQFVGLEQVHFVVSNGRSWMFCFISKQEGQYVSYQSRQVPLTKEGGVDEISVILVLLSEWLSPSMKFNTLYTIVKNDEDLH